MAGEFSERWRLMHNWLAEFGDSLLTLRDLFKAASDAEKQIASAEGEIAELSLDTERARADLETVAKRLAEQKLYLATAEGETAARRASIDAEITEYRAAKEATVDAEIAHSMSAKRQKAETDLIALRADIENRTANRDALAEEVATLMESAKTLDRMNAEKTGRLRAVEAKLAEAGKFALGS